MINYYFKIIKEEDFKSILQPREGCWIHVDEGSNEDLNHISTLTGLDYTDLQDCLDKYEVPRIERIKQNVLIFTRHPADQESGLYTTPLTMILTSHYFITICPHKSFIVDGFLSRKTKLSTSQKSKLLLHLLLKITQEFTSQIKKVRHQVLKQEKEMIHIDSEDIAALSQNEEVLNQYASTLIPLRSVLAGITSGRYTNFYEKEQELLEDLLNAIKQSEDLCSITMKSIRSLRDSYQTIFTNNSQKTIKLLTALTIIFSFPTMIASLYGMNVSLPFSEARFAFVYIIIFIILLVILGIYIFHRKKWL